MKLRYLLIFILITLCVQKSYAQAKVEFIENRGQWGKWFKYKAATSGGNVCLEKDGFRYIIGERSNNSKIDSFHHGVKKDMPVLKFHCYKMTFVGANDATITGEKPEKDYYNYFLGNDSSRWKGGIHPYRALNYSHLYNGIDAHVSSEKGNIVYDFIVEPQADASQVQLKFEGQDKIKISNNNLVISTSIGDVTEQSPIAYQYVNYERVNVPCKYKLRDNVVSYDFPKDYDHSQRLFIDPTVVFCTLTGSTADNWGFTATYDDSGYFYNGGLVNDLNFGGTYPVSPGAFQTTFGGGYVASVDSTYASDIAIIKYDPTGRFRIYATYLGGTGNERPHSMIVDQGFELIVAGRSRSSDYPVTSGAYQPANAGGSDIVITKFNASGTGLIGSTYIGGTGNDGVNFDSTELGYGELKFNYGDDARSEVQLDKIGNIYVTGSTNSTNFPTTSTAIRTTLSGMQDGVVCKFNSGLTSLIWSTYIGGSGSDAGYVLAFDTSQNDIYVAGGTNSTNFPTTTGTLHPTYQGGTADGFILKFKNSTPYNLLKGTYVGTSHYDQIYGIQVSGDDNVYVMGQSLGGAFPVTTGVYSNANSCQFVMKTDNNLAADLVSTVFGNSDPDSTNISPVAFLVDTCENVYISGWGGDLGLTSTINATGTAHSMPITSDAIRPTTVYGRDFYFIVLGPGMTSLRYATYYGRSCVQQWEGAHVDGGTSRFSRQGIIYQAMCAKCGGIYKATSNPGGCPDPFPTTSGVWSMLDSSSNCNEAALKIAFNIGPVTANIIAGPTTNGCAPLTVDFTNLSNNGLTFVWDFGDGSPTTTTFSPTHTFTASGVFTVTLHASNSNACFRTDDTAYLFITVDTAKITPAFTDVLQDSCGPFIAVFTNGSTDHIGTPTYQWYFGDGTSYTGPTPPAHTYADSGTYVVTLVMSDALACKSPDSVTHTLHFYPFNLSASFTIPDSICIGSTFAPTINLVNTTGTSWTFAPGQTSTAADPTHTYFAVGTYTVTLVASNPAACNGNDTLRETIKVLSGPTADFSFTPTVPTPNASTVFTNLSTNATRYSWDFGDNTNSTDKDPTHQYNKTGNYKVCLSAYNATNCPASICKEVPTDVEPLVGVPSAFSPNGDGENDVLYVRGAAIATLDLKIYNRWGQLVFETTTKEKGWDGTFNGQPQPIEAYAYVLNCTFIDGTSKLLKGNITLLR